MALEKGQEAPDFEAESSKGKIKLSSFRGKKVILHRDALENFKDLPNFMRSLKRIIQK